MIPNVRNKSTTELEIAKCALRLHDTSDLLFEGIAKCNMHPYFNDKVQRKALGLRKMAVQLGYALFEPDGDAFSSLEKTIATVDRLRRG